MSMNELQTMPYYFSDEIASKPYIYNIGVLTVNIEFMWLGTKRMERLTFSESFHPFRAKPHKFYISESIHPFHAKPHKFYIYRQYTNIVFILQ